MKHKRKNLTAHQRAILKRHDRRMFTRLTNRLTAWVTNTARAAAGRDARAEARDDAAVAFHALVEKMTNPERHAWAKAGYPGGPKHQIDKLLPFAEAAHRRLTGEWVTLAAGRR